MDNLSSKQRAFIKLMKDGEDFERHGFELLLKRPDFDEFFEALMKEGLFDPERNPGPMAGEKPGYYRIPYWPPLAYLEAAAKRAGERMDLTLADRVMDVVRKVSRWQDDNNKPCDNANTWSAFARLFGSLPNRAVSIADIGLIPAWLDGRFRQSTVGHGLATGTLHHFLNSEDTDDWKKACVILYHCTAFEFVHAGPEARKTPTDVQTLIDDYWLKELVSTTAGAFGRKMGKAAADVFLDRLKAVFARAMDGYNSWAFRPAIEDHQQNYEWNGPYNRFVEGMRDTMLAWIDSDAEAASRYVEGLFNSGSEIVERVAIHLVNQRFETLRSLAPKVISSSFFDSGHRHELHVFLTRHFRSLSDEVQTATIDAIRSLPLPDRGEDSQRRQHFDQQAWLSAIAGHGNETADAWMAELSDTIGPTRLSFPPDFNSYHESRSGPGPTPYNVDELVVFARDGIIIKKLNSFTPSDDWNGPSIRSLSDTVINAVAVDPQIFVDRLPQFLEAKPEYQYAIVAGFKKLWDAWDGNQEGLAWDRVWPKLTDFFEALLADENLWMEDAAGEPPLLPNRSWIPPLISEFLRAGTRSDDKAYAPDLLTRTLLLVVTLLEKSAPQAAPAEDKALDVAINTAKGKAIEALVDHALRCCRLSDQASNTHAEVWHKLQPHFDRELAKCRNANFEFSAIAGSSIGNLYYMSETWVNDNFRKLFPTEFTTNCLSALDGLAYATPTKSVYTELVASGVLVWALGQEMIGEHARKSLLQRMGLAYLWEQEVLEGPRFSHFFETLCIKNLEDISNYFWMVRGERLEEKQKERILLFWDRCVSWSKSLESPPANLLSHLSLLSFYLTAIDQRALGWLLAVAPHASVNYNADRLIQQLERLAAGNPQETGRVLHTLLEVYHPTYDYNDRLKQLIILLADNPASRADAIYCLEQVRHLPGMVQMYSQLSLPRVTAPE